MSRARLHWQGMGLFQAELKQWPTALARAAEAIVNETADAAAADVIQQYPVVTGNLAKGVRVTRRSKDLVARAVVQNRAPHAWWYDNGTQLRHWDSGKNTGKMWGATGPPHTFRKTMNKHQRAMLTQLIALLTESGLTVTGDAA